VTHTATLTPAHACQPPVHAHYPLPADYLTSPYCDCLLFLVVCEVLIDLKNFTYRIVLLGYKTNVRLMTVAFILENLR
jgi:hypothetical protein